MHLDGETFNILVDGMTQIKSRETLVNFSINDWSHLKKDSRKKMHKNLYKTAYPDDIIESAVTMDKLKGAGIITKDMVKKNG